MHKIRFVTKHTLVVLLAVFLLATCQAPVLLNGNAKILQLDLSGPFAASLLAKNATANTSTSRLLSSDAAIVDVSIVTSDTGLAIFNGPATLKKSGIKCTASLSAPNVPMGRRLTITVSAKNTNGNEIFQAIGNYVLTNENASSPLKMFLAPTNMTNLAAIDYSAPSTQNRTLAITNHTIAYIALTVPANLVGKTTRLCWDYTVNLPIFSLTDPQGNEVKAINSTISSEILFIPTSAGVWYVTCNNSGPADIPLANINYGLNEYFYYTASGSTNIYWARLNSATGNLTIPTSNSISATMTPSQIAIDPNGKYLYASYATAGQVYVYSINPIDGSLTSLSYLGGLVSPNLITVYPDGLHMAVTNNNASNPTVYSLIFDKNSSILTQTGNVNTYVSGQPITAMVFNPLKNLLYVINQKSISQTSQYLSAFAVAPNSFTLSKSFNYGNGIITNEVVNSIAIAPDFQNLLITYYGGDSGGSFYNIMNLPLNSSGGIDTGSTNVALVTNSDNLRIDPTGKIVAYRQGGNTLYVISYDLSRHVFNGIDASSASVIGTGYTQAVFDTEGKFLYAISNAMPTKLVYPQINGTGSIDVSNSVTINKVTNVLSACSRYLQ